MKIHKVSKILLILSKFFRVLFRLMPTSYLRLLAHDFVFYQRNVEFAWASESELLKLSPKKMGSRLGLLRGMINGPFAHIDIRERHEEFQHYGHDYIIKRYANLHRNFTKNTLTAEHAVIVDDCKASSRLGSYQNVSTVFTMSKCREELLRRFGIPSLAIGPYIAYSRTPLKEDRIFEIKKKLGRVLTYFPMHFTESDLIYADHFGAVDYLKFLSSVLKVDTVLICYYWFDYAYNTFGKSYDMIPHLKACCGHRNNPFFLDQLNLILTLSDYTCSNNVGTVAGYSEFLNKRHLVFPRELRAKVSPKNPYYIDKYVDDLTARKRIAEALQLCSGENKERSSEVARELVSYYWGFDSIQPVVNLREVLTKGKIQSS